MRIFKHTKSDRFELNTHLDDLFESIYFRLFTFNYNSTYKYCKVQYKVYHRINHIEALMIL